MKALRNFDIVTALVVLAGKIQQRRVEKLKDREAALKATIKFATEALIDAERDRQSAQQRHRKIGE
ncbi:virion structural protein [Pseudomonas phage phi15]|uniref:Virion structural protein n=1 Tax=Pseudomonas phage phi15 TaxID=988656 RepID=F0V6Y6_9CAUD|nr:virion structural protein [Pseudomonas phage phi15]CBZ41998.1 virion structural protein [Pseudomonas phage phi15]